MPEEQTASLLHTPALSPMPQFMSGHWLENRWIPDKYLADNATKMLASDYPTSLALLDRITGKTNGDPTPDIAQN